MYEYAYSAFGKSDKEEETGIGAKNPFRYRGYYYDEETGLYYLKSRYYDPETGRFITIDDISYIDPETINGLNLYAYCGNNPVMRVDPNGNLFFIFSLLIGIAVGAITGGLIGGVTSYAKGDSFWGGFLSGAMIGGALGGALVLGGATMLAIAGKAVTGFFAASTILGKLSLGVGMAITSFNMSMVAGSFGYAINESMNGRNVNTGEMMRQGINTGIKGINAFIVGGILAATGAYNNLLVTKTIAKINFSSIMRTLLHSFNRAIVSVALQFNWRQGLK